MALISPGVEVTVIDESQYLPAAAGTVPFILFASAQNKISGTGTGVAAGTLAVNAGKVYLITSQRDMATTFGNPFFYTTTAGTPINGYELNEYGLLAAYSVLGVSNRAFMMRANIDLAALQLLESGFKLHKRFVQYKKEDLATQNAIFVAQVIS